MSILSVASGVSAQELECSIDIPEHASETELQERLVLCEREIAEQQRLLQNKQREKTSIERDLDILDYQIRQNQYKINARKINLQRIGGDIEYTRAEISVLDGRIGRMREGASELIRRTYELDDRSVVEMLLGQGNIADFFENIGSINFIQSSLKSTLDEMRLARIERESTIETLEGRQTQEERLKRVQEIEKAKKQTRENEQQRLLSLTKKEEQQYLAEVQERQKAAAQIRNRILKLKGGGELTFGEALQLARIPESHVGVRAAFSLAVLTQESALDGKIGANLGRCFYNTPSNNTAGTVMSNSQKPSFLYIMQQLGLEPSATPISCPIQSDGSYGGAMGPAQFMPRTWWDIDTQTGYAKRVAKLTGSSFANPFDNLDAFTANALYLSDALDYCSGIYAGQFDLESCAAARYYAGGNWRKHKNGYGGAVARRAATFQKDIDFLDAQVSG